MTASGGQQPLIQPDQVHCEMSLHNSFHFFFAAQPNSLAEARSTCDDLIHCAPSCPHPSQHPTALTSMKIQCHLKWLLQAHHPHDVLHALSVVATATHSPSPHSPCYCSYNNLSPPSPLPLQSPWLATSIAIDTAPSTAVNAVDPAIPTFLTTHIFLCKLFLR